MCKMDPTIHYVQRAEDIPKKKRKRPTVPEDKRLRRNVACLECRRQKLKCYGNNPCQRCLDKGVQCVFETIPKPNMREIHENMQRLKALENIVQSLIPQQDLSLQALETRVQLLSLSETNSNTPGDLDNSSNSQVSVANSFSRPGSARTSMQAENMDNMDNVNNVLQGTDVGTPVMVAKDEKTHYEGVGSTGGFLARLDQIIRGGSINDNGNKDVIEPYQNIGQKSIDKSSTIKSVHNVIKELPPKEIAVYLINTFLKIAEGNNYYYFSSADFLEKIETIYEHPDGVTEKDCGFLCIFLGSLAIGSLFVYIRHPEMAVAVGDSESIPSSWKYPGIRFYEAAKTLIPDVISLCTVETVQSLFLIGLYITSTQAHETPYLYLGIAIRAAIANGMHKQQTVGELDPVTIEKRNRVFWAVYTMERKVAIYNGLPDTLPIDEIDAALPMPCKELDTTDRMATFQGQHAAVSLTILSAKIFEMWKLSKKEGKLTSMMLNSLIDELEDWRAKLPKELEIQNLENQEKGFRGVVHIHISYFLARISIGRPFMLFLIGQKTQSMKTGIPIDTLSYNYYLSYKMSKYCYDSASVIISLLLFMRNKNYLSIYSYLDYNSAHTASFILLIYSLIEPSDQCNGLIDSAIDILEFISRRSYHTRQGTRMIKSLKNSTRNSIIFRNWLLQKEQLHAQQEVSMGSILTPPNLNGNMINSIPVMTPNVAQEYPPVTPPMPMITTIPQQSQQFRPIADQFSQFVFGQPQPNEILHQMDKTSPLDTNSTNIESMFNGQEWVNSMYSESCFPLLANNAIESILYPQQP